VPPHSADCLPPIRIERVFEDPDEIRRLVEAHGPYFPVQRYFSQAAEYHAAAGDRDTRAPMIVAPNFRGDWAYDEALVEGADALLRHPAFVQAAGELFGSDLVRPQIVYCNLTWQLPFDQGAGHTDVPAFRGIDRTRFPIWLLNAMGHSRLFEEERIRIATAVSWFYLGKDGGLCYWPDGPDAAPKIHEGSIHNTALVGDNDRMFHRVRPVGPRDRGMLGDMTLDTCLCHDGGDRWSIREGGSDGSARAEFPFSELRISLSWKACVFRDAEDMRRVDLHSDDLKVADVVDRFRRDLEDRGDGCEAPEDPLRDTAWVETLARNYVRSPSVQAA